LRLVAETGQHPEQVCRACVRQVRRWSDNPWSRLLAIEALEPYAPPMREFSGRWIPAAIQSWARTLTFYREPAGADAPGELVASLPLTVALGGGDCDDLATAQATIALTLGLRARIGYLWTAPDYAAAHIVCAVSPDWAGSPGWLIADPEVAEPADPGAWPGIRWFDCGRLLGDPTTEPTNAHRVRPAPYDRPWRR